MRLLPILCVCGNDERYTFWGFVLLFVRATVILPFRTVCDVFTNRLLFVLQNHNKIIYSFSVQKLEVNFTHLIIEHR